MLSGVPTSPTSASLCAMKVSKKYLKPMQKKCTRGRQQRREYKKLKRAIPALARTPRVPKVEVVREAIMYIDHLHTEILKRFFTGSKFNPAKVNSPSAHLVQQLFPAPPKRISELMLPTLSTSHATQTPSASSPDPSPQTLHTNRPVQPFHQPTPTLTLRPTPNLSSSRRLKGLRA